MLFSGIVFGLVANTFGDASETVSMLQANPNKTLSVLQANPAYERALDELVSSDRDMNRLVKDLRRLIKKPKDFHPQDEDTYGPFMVRLAWHCSGTFRVTDNLGGCAGGRIRYAPEIEWADNGNLDKAVEILSEIKADRRFQDSVSWGDLFVLAGTLAIYDMGGPTKEFCFGRIDQEEDVGRPISEQLNCDPGWTKDNQPNLCDRSDDTPGQLLGGLIYVNPEGPGDPPNPNPYLSAQDVERTFGRMGMTPIQTVALVGGGHAFGRAHGGSADSNGVKTSMFDGKWTPKPTKWDNDYFKGLIGENWEKVQTPGDTGKSQWQTVDRDSPIADTMMLTADLALKAHTLYSKHATTFAEDQGALDLAFADAWWTLTTNGDGWLPRKRCIRLDDYDKN